MQRKASGTTGPVVARILLAPLPPVARGFTCHRMKNLRKQEDPEQLPPFFLSSPTVTCKNNKSQPVDFSFYLLYFSYLFWFSFLDRSRFSAFSLLCFRWLTIWPRGCWWLSFYCLIDGDGGERSVVWLLVLVGNKVGSTGAGGGRRRTDPSLWVSLCLGCYWRLWFGLEELADFQWRRSVAAVVGSVP